MSLELYIRVRDNVTGECGTIVDYVRMGDPTSGYLIEPDNVAQLPDDDPRVPCYGRGEKDLTPLE